MANLIEELLVKPGTRANLADRDPGDRLGLVDKTVARDLVATIVHELDGLQNALWAENKRSVLLVLQGLDCSGKDGAIRRVLSGINPQGTEVTSFKAPNDAELDHDYLWRVHAVCPPRGRIGVFNRSHYEEVLAARFIGVIDHDRARQRYRHLIEFERMLDDEGTAIVKAYLHISKDEQKERLQARLDDPAKNWKFNPADLETREQWDDYMKGYEEVLSETSTEHAPWYVVPADHKWVRDVAVARLLLDTFKRLDPRFPPADPALRDIVIT